MPFNTLPILTRPLVLTGSLNFDGNPSNVDHGKMWTQDTEYGDFYSSAWAMPVTPSWLGYFASDGSGGQHAYLAGFSSDTEVAHFTGNIWNGSATCSFNSVDEIPLGDWVHCELVIDGNVMYALVNGVCSFYGSLTSGGTWTSTFSGARQYNSGGSNGHLYAGGSYHDNLGGQLARMRIVEGDNCGVTTSNPHIPRDYDGYVLNADGATLTRASFACDYSSPARAFFDMGAGFESRIHHGKFSRDLEATSFPAWKAGDVSASTYVPTSPSVPEGALVFDSFSRVNNLELFDNLSSLGSTEGGSLGTKTWKTAYFDNSNRGAGVLYGQAVLYPGLAPEAWVDTDRTNIDIRVTRPGTKWDSTGIIARRKDANNWYRITGNDTSITFNFNESGSQTFPTGFTVTSGWTVLRVVMSGTTMSVYTDGNLAGTKTVINDAGALGHGIYGGGTVNRFDDFTLFA